MNSLKNVYIMVDCEGISGIWHGMQLPPKGHRSEEGRRCMTRDINTVVAACLACGAEKIAVRDCHGGGGTAIWDELSEGAEYIMGNTGEARFYDLDAYDAVILLGYHAMAGTLGGLLEHSDSPGVIQHYWLNGLEVGEIGLDAFNAGDHGKPVIMVSGDDYTCAETSALMPWAATAQVKKGLGLFGAQLLSVGAAKAELERAVADAFARWADMEPLICEKPATIRVEVTNRSSLPWVAGKPYLRIINGNTFEVDGDTVNEAFFRTI